jgi:hypothetical protein
MGLIGAAFPRQMPTHFNEANNSTIESGGMRDEKPGDQIRFEWTAT